MTNPDYTALLFIIDRSGSMYSIRTDMEGGITTLLKDQEEIEGKVTVDFAYFDDKFIYEDKMLALTAAAPKINPRGGTALNDAIVRASTEFGASLAALPEEERPGKVLVVIVTDGQENSSRESTTADVKNTIETQQSEFNWNYVFLGADENAVLTASNFGIQRGSAMRYTASADGVATASAGLSTYTRDFRTKGTATFDTAEPAVEDANPTNTTDPTKISVPVSVADFRRSGLNAQQKT